MENEKNVRSHDLTKDGYTYKRSTSNKKFGDSVFKRGKQTNYVYSCVGRKSCVNDKCTIFQRFNEIHSVIQSAVSNICFHCDEPLVPIECPGKKYVMSSSASKFVCLYYEAEHSCGEPGQCIDSSLIDELEEMFKSNLGLTSNQAFRVLWAKRVAEGASQKTLTDLVAIFAKPSISNNLKANVKRSLYPLGVGLEAVEKLKVDMEQYPDLGVIIDIVYDSYVCANCNLYTMQRTLSKHGGTTNNVVIDRICKKCTFQMKQTGAFVFITTKTILSTVKELSKGGVFENSTIFVDHQNGRLADWNTFGCFFYDHQLQELANIMTVHCLYEDELSVWLAFMTLDKHLEKNNLPKFDPFGFTTDNAGGLLCGIRRKFGSNIPIRTCKFHYLNNVWQICSRAIGTRQEQGLFLRYCHSLLKAGSAGVYHSIYDEFIKWIKLSSQREAALSGFIAFWHNSRSRWSDAYVNTKLTGCNLSEAIQSKYSKSNKSKNQSLISGVQSELGEAHRYQLRLSQLIRGEYKGQGPSRKQLDEKEALEELERLENIGYEAKDLNRIFRKMGLPMPENLPVDMPDLSTKEPLRSNFCLFMNAQAQREREVAAYQSEPNSPCNYKRRTPAGPRPTPKKPGRKRKAYPSRFDNTFHQDELEPPIAKRKKQQPTKEISDDFENTDCDELEPPSAKRKKQQTAEEKIEAFQNTDSEDDDPDVPDIQTILSPKRTSSILVRTLSSSSHVNIQDLPTKDDEHGTDSLTFARRVRQIKKEKGIAKSKEKAMPTVSSADYFSADVNIVISSDEDTVEKAEPGQYKGPPRSLDTDHFSKQKTKAADQQQLYTVKQISGRKSFVITKSDKTVHTVTFSSDNVFCSCLAMAELIKKGNLSKNANNEVCKHVAYIVLKTDPMWWQFYHGKRFFSWSEGEDLSNMLEFFDPDREIEKLDYKKAKKVEMTEKNDKVYHPINDCCPTVANNETFAIQNAVKDNFREFPQMHIAKSNAPSTIWYAEVYTKVRNVGRSPACRSCNETIYRGKLCLRADVAELFKNKQSDQWRISIKPHRFCLNNICYR